ncbi:DegT/DnrJ/EryC1/StrS aminotransferase family protein [Streptomyces sp. Amel2xC10]|uniref:DegT/DnrJ/EryC1/StrS family aminotransferase n=1 Tax=Streptomyces sp. Amel2xC10 TaxID=1305826 RepID=UPI000A08C1E5|nr:DegT/DnrJ/EryC1/StrS family aminotransferase [Streptomyces sp. Amel2xC10]SMF50745.1 dTDP-4-amino-4,6-dideoxygalactose transaminase [Streptomyces sp. Amel2xC10]
MISPTRSTESITGTESGHPVPFFTQAGTFDDCWPDIERHLNEMFDRGKYSHGRQVAELEKALAAYTGARHVVAVNSGTDALVLLLRACGVGPGDEVVVPAFSFVASASSVALARATPVFADIDPETYALDPASAEAAVTGRTRAVMPVHLFWQLADMGAIGALAERHGLKVVEDSAEAIGMRRAGVHAGLLGDGGVLSFFPTKTLGALGDAGAVLTDDPEIAERVAILRHHGRMGRTVDHIAGISNLSGASGTNSKMDDIQASVLLGKLPRLDAAIARRAELAAAYTELLSGVPGVLRLPTVTVRDVPADPVFYVYVIEVERRDALVEHLTREGVGTEVYYPTPLHLQPCFAELGHRRGDFPHAEAACERTVALPFHPDLGLDDVQRVCEAVRRFYTGAAS